MLCQAFYALLLCVAIRQENQLSDGNRFFSCLPTLVGGTYNPDAIMRFEFTFPHRCYRHTLTVWFYVTMDNLLRLYSKPQLLMILPANYRTLCQAKK